MKLYERIENNNFDEIDRNRAIELIEGGNGHLVYVENENYFKLQKENEELKKFITEGITVAPHSPYKNYRLDFLRENFVSKKKIKDKIEELKNNPLKIKQNDKYYYETHAYNKIIIGVLQELIEEREEK